MRFSIDERTPMRAVKKGLETLNKALPRAGFTDDVELMGFECQTAEELERDLATSNAPELVGVSEVAEMLEVSRQRVSELSRSPDFPAPIAHLASGPVWRRGVIVRHVGRWPRRPGRPKKAAAAS